MLAFAAERGSGALWTNPMSALCMSPSCGAAITAVFTLRTFSSVRGSQPKQTVTDESSLSANLDVANGNRLK